ncbi:hypothetical protein [Actinoplanes sp. G11-F43]|uniref:hypothetical protein n=1 Tax=Actinoplanes sp. G11-F43 TaxID=3424130 RepID=UPI003D358B1E
MTTLVAARGTALPAAFTARKPPAAAEPAPRSADDAAEQARRALQTSLDTRQ